MWITIFSFCRLSKLRSFRVAVFLRFLPLTSLLTKLPFKSNMCSIILSFDFLVLPMRIRLTGSTSSIFTVKIPYIRASKERGCVLTCSKYLMNTFLKVSRSLCVMVLMMKFLSWEKKKKEPLLPWDSPARNTLSRFSSGARLFFISLMSMPSKLRRNANISGANSVTSTSSLMISTSSD